MRTCFVFLIFSVFIFSCKRYEDQPHPCDFVIKCIDPTPRVYVGSVDSTFNDSLQGQITRRYVKDNTFSQVLEETTTDSVRIESAYDYELYFPILNKAVRISNITFKHRVDTLCFNSDQCANGLDSITVTFDGAPYKYRLDGYQGWLHTVYIDLHN